MTNPKWENGTERCLEVFQKLKRKGMDFDVIVNIQGDEPFIEAHHIETVADVVASSDAVMGTLARPATGEAVRRGGRDRGENGERGRFLYRACVGVWVCGCVGVCMRTRARFSLGFSVVYPLVSSIIVCHGGVEHRCGGVVVFVE